jgi:photosystem II stability/assembly factor-like uncharacterized protein
MRKVVLALAFVGLLLLSPAGTGSAKSVVGASPSVRGPALAFASDLTSPTVTHIGPGSAPNDIDTPVIITGTGFTVDASSSIPPMIYLGVVPLTDVSLVDSATLSASVPWGMDPGDCALTVINPDGGTGSLAGAFAVTQGIGQWNGGNLFGGEVRQILLKPGNPNTIYALAYQVGLFRSTDAGENWTFVNGNVIGSNPDFVLDPLHPSWLYSYRYGDDEHQGLYRSEDDGDTWTRLLGAWPDGRNIEYGEVYPSPDDSHTLFVRSAGAFVRSESALGASSLAAPSAAGSALGLIKSTNSGLSWSIVADMDGVSVQDVAYDPTDPLKMALATQDGHVYQSIDGGDHWSEVNKPPLSNIGSIAYNPYRSGEVWVASEVGAGGICKSTDTSFTAWQDVFPGSQGSWVIKFTSADSVYVTWAHSGDGGLTSQRFGPQTSSGEMSLDPTDSQIGYIGDDTYGVQKTVDGGEHWEVKSQGLSGMACYSMEVSSSDPLRVFATFEHWPGIYRSDDGSNNWMYLPIDSSMNVRQVREDPFDSQRLYVAADSGFYVSSDRGENWTALGWSSTPPTSLGLMPYAMAADSHQPGHLLVGFRTGTSVSHDLDTGLLYSSSDYGVSWQSVVMPEDPLSWITGIAFDSETTGTVYLTTDGTGVYKSTDSGVTWTRIDDRSQTDMQKAASVTMATHPTPTVIVGAGGGAGGPYRSTDGGATWRVGQTPDNSGAGPFMFANGNSTRLYAPMWSGLWFSSNVGDSWERAAGAFGKLHVMALGSAMADTHTLVYAATCGGDVGAAGSAAAPAFLSSLAAFATPHAAFAPASALVDAGIYRYVQMPHTLTYTPGPGGLITGTRVQTVAFGSRGSAVTAAPNKRYHFLRWSDGLARATRSDEAVQADLSVTANFARNSSRPTILRSPNKSTVTVKRSKKVGRWTLSAAFRDKDGTPIAGARVYLQTSKNGKSKWTRTQYRLATNAAGRASKAFSSRAKKTLYFRWHFPAANGYLKTYATKQKVVVR